MSYDIVGFHSSLQATRLSEIQTEALKSLGSRDEVWRKLENLFGTQIVLAEPNYAKIKNEFWTLNISFQEDKLGQCLHFLFTIYGDVGQALGALNQITAEWDLVLFEAGNGQLLSNDTIQRSQDDFLRYKSKVIPTQSN